MQAHGDSVGDAVFFLALPIAAALVPLLTYLVLRRFVFLQDRATAALRIAAEREAAEQASAAAIRQELREVEALARPVLQGLVEGQALTAEVHAEIRALEGQIRDHLRCGMLPHSLVQAVAAARRRGVRVVLLGEDFTPLTERIADRLADLLARAQLNEATIRVLPAGRDAVVSVVTSSGGGAELLFLDENGQPVARA